MEHLGFTVDLKLGLLQVPQKKVENSPKGIGKISDSFRNDNKKNGSHFGSHQVVFNGNAFSKGIHRPVGPVCKPTGNSWLGPKTQNSIGVKGTGQRNGFSYFGMERKKFPWKSNCEGTALRFLAGGLGWGGQNIRPNSARILERKTSFAHKCEGVGSSHKYSAVPCKIWGARDSQSRQFGHFCILDQGRGKDPQFKSTGQTIFKMVHGKAGPFDSSAGQKFRGPSRWTQQMGQGQGGLHVGQRSIQMAVEKNEQICHTPGGHVCLPRESSTSQICGKVPPLAGLGGRCTKVSFEQNNLLLCKPPMENNWQMAAQIKGKPPYNMHDDSTPLGFKCMVAPTIETARQGDPSFSDTPLSGDVQKLLGRVNATSQMAPSLSVVIRQGLQTKQVSPEAAETFLGDLKSLSRYEKSFKLFWAFCNIKGMDTISATMSEVAGLILQFEKIMPTHARFAYASLLLIPGLEQLFFSPLLRALKRKWNSSQARYFSFYDAADPVRKLAGIKLKWDSIADVRLRLVMACRFFMLCRNIDLARMYRSFSSVDGKPFILIQRKGWRIPQWEAMVVIESCPAICPWTLLKRYVQLTSQDAAAGSLVFRALTPPYTPLCANSIGSLTRKGLQQLGLDISVWKPHSTRGAGVTMFKKLGLTSEEVCEVGKWKNVSAFTSHYLRLGASHTVGDKIHSMLHNVSPLGSADPDLTWTTRKYDLGGNVREGDAQSNGEPTLPPLGNELPHAVGMDSTFPDEMGMCYRVDEPGLCLQDVASSSNATGTLGPSVPFAAHTRLKLASRAMLSSACKRKRERGGTPPAKFAFASPKGKEKQD